MNNARWSLLLLLGPIVVAGQICTNSWPVDFQAVAATDQGPVFAAISGKSIVGTEIWRWSRNLAERERLWRIQPHFHGLHANRDGSIVICEYSEWMAAYDSRQRKVLWGAPTQWDWKSQLVGDDQYLMRLAGTTLNAFDIENGSVIDRVDDVRPNPGKAIRQVCFDEDQLSLQWNDDTLTTFAWTNNRFSSVAQSGPVSELGTLGRFFADPRTQILLMPPPMSAAMSDSDEVVVTQNTSKIFRSIRIRDRKTNQILRQDYLGLNRTAREFLLTLAALASVAWVLVLVHDGRSSTSRWRVALDLGILVAFFSLPNYAGHYPGLGDLVPDQIVDSQPQKIFAMLTGVIACSLFFLLLAIKRPFYLWTATLIGCTLPFLLPIAAIAMLIRLRPWLGNATTPRFGIAQMLMTTAALAVLIGVGRLYMDLVPVGFFYAAILLLALLLSINRTMAILTICACSMSIVMLACRDPRYTSGGVWYINHLLMMILTFSFLRIYGCSWFDHLTSWSAAPDSIPSTALADGASHCARKCLEPRRRSDLPVASGPLGVAHS